LAEQHKLFANDKKLKSASILTDQIQELSKNATKIYVGKLNPVKSITKPKFFIKSATNSRVWLLPEGLPHTTGFCWWSLIYAIRNGRIK
jgi:hypothetical protein